MNSQFENKLSPCGTNLFLKNLIGQNYSFLSIKKETLIKGGAEAVRARFHQTQKAMKEKYGVEDSV